MRLLFARKYVDQLKIELQNERECAVRPWATRTWSCEDRCIIDRGRWTKRQSKETEKGENIVWVFVCFNHDSMHTATVPPYRSLLTWDLRSVVLLRWMIIVRGRDKTTEQSH